MGKKAILSANEMGPLTFDILSALRHSGVRGLTRRDISAGLQTHFLKVNAVCAILVEAGTIEQFGDTVYLPARTWARFIDVRRKQGHAKSFAADVAAMLAGNGEAV